MSKKESRNNNDMNNTNNPKSTPSDAVETKSDSRRKTSPSTTSKTDGCRECR